jgi:hypothetical protein
MHARERIAAHCAENEEAIVAYTQELRRDSENYCVAHGGHFFSPWHVTSTNPIFNVPCLEERRCAACGSTETRTPEYAQLDIQRFASTSDDDPFLFRQKNAPRVIDMDLDDEDD